MKRHAQRSRLNVESLERRDTPALFNPGPVLEPVTFGSGAVANIFVPPGGWVFEHEFESVGSISLSAQGTLTIAGTSGDDIIKVFIDQPVLQQSPMFLIGGWDHDAFGDQLVVRITDAAGNIRSDASGNPLERRFNPNSVNLIEANAYSGNDRIINSTNKTMIHMGGDGNDTATGGPGMDILNGGAGDDSLSAGAGNDQLYGLAGNDSLNGDAGRDIMQGGDGNDTMSGGDGDDSMLGEAGRDQLSGGNGNDSLSGGAGNDTVIGDAGDDLLHGDEDMDLLSGGAGNDSLFGDGAEDYLRGGDGRDGLFGGAGKSRLEGGPGIDRFLRWDMTGNSTTIDDKQGNESLTIFKNTTGTQTFNNDGNTLRYQGATWLEDEIEQVDSGMAFLHHEAGNTRLLRRSNGGNMTMLRFGDYIPYNATDGNNDANDQRANEAGPRFAGFNKGDGRIYLNHGSFDSTTYDVARIVVHEFAHNWDKENGKFEQWKSLSGWVNTSTPNANQTLSRDGDWVYDTTAEFARDYGKTNPLEDFTTSFEAYFHLKSGNLSFADMVRLTPKLNFIGLFISSLA